MDYPQHMVTVGNRRHNDAESYNIGQLFKRGVLTLHFAPNGIRGFFAPRNFDLNTGILQIVIKRIDNP